MRSLRESQGLRSREYLCAREYLFRGPPIQMSYIESRNYQWIQYEKEVKNILEHPDAASWLDRRLDPSMREKSRKKVITRSWNAKDRAKCVEKNLAVYILLWITHIANAITHVMLATRSWKAKKRAISHGLKTFVYLLFWITHITAALSYVILANEPEPIGSTTLDS